MNLLVVLFLVLALCVPRTPAQTSQNSWVELDEEAFQAANSGDLDRSIKLYSEASSQLLARGQKADAGVVYMNLGELAQIHGQLPLAEADFRRGLDLLEHSASHDDLRLVEVLDDLGWLYVTWGKAAQGAELIKDARERAKHAPSNEPRLVTHLDTQAAYATVIGKYSEGQRIWKQAIEIAKQNFGADDLKYDNVLLHFGQADSLIGDYAAAVELFRKYLDIEQRRQGKDNISITLAAGELGNVYTHLRKYPEAQVWFDQAFAGKNLEEQPLIHSVLLSYLGDFYMAQSDWRNAESRYRQGLQIQQEVMGENQAVAKSMLSLAKALEKLHSKTEARNLLARARAILEAKKGPSDGQTVDVLALRRSD